MRLAWLAFAGIVACGDVVVQDACPISDGDGGQYTCARGAACPAGDGCNTCFCDDDGRLSCTLVGCPGR
jgi:hypothetical protein